MYTVSRVVEPCFRVVVSNQWEQIGDGLIENILGSCFGRAEQQLQLGPGLFDWVQMGRVGWQVEQFCASGFDSFAHAFDLMRTQVIHHHHVARPQLRAQDMIQIGKEDLCVGRFFDGHGCDHAPGAHSAEDGHDFPVAARRRFMNAPASNTSRIVPRHRSGDAALIKEDQLVKRGRMDFREELCPPPLSGFSVSLGCVE
jgi:hypothetical protein